MMIVLFGLRNCDSCKKARQWLEGHGIAATFIDIRADALAGDVLDRWIDALGWETLLNRRGTTWRGLSEADRDALDAERARALMLAHPALVKRPVIDDDGAISVGFDETVRTRLLAGKGRAR